MRVLVCGDRNWTDPAPIRKALTDLLDRMGTFELVEGGARGADRYAKFVAIELGIIYHEVPADWNQYGLSAGPIRNEKMLVDFSPDLVLAFHDRLNFSKGTRDMIDRAQAQEIHVILYSHDGKEFRSLPRCFR